MAIRRREIAKNDLVGYAFEEIACVSCTGACPSKIWALYNGEPQALCGANRQTIEFLERFNKAFHGLPGRVQPGQPPSNDGNER